ncbi:hypothetical protein QYF61_006699 [Mycteria americana]|uniref:Uncharacterized protein n=1 Tax=Mycteria americana TaxID=33587 RepID=A0AAN7P3A5_MYCAM|nr:hypothetical protein QYF61_006699 [Mycteria americana]
MWSDTRIGCQDMLWISILEEIQNLTVHGSEHPALGSEQPVHSGWTAGLRDTLHSGRYVTLYKNVLASCGELRLQEVGLKLCQGGFRLDIRKNFFTERVIKRWNRLPREVVESPSLEVFKRRVDVALRDMQQGSTNESLVAYSVEQKAENKARRNKKLRKICGHKSGCHFPTTLCKPVLEAEAANSSGFTTISPALRRSCNLARHTREEQVAPP